jgi:urea transporter
MVNLAENNSRALVGTAVGFLVVTYVAVALRTYVRSTLTRSFQLDDWLMLVAQVCLRTQAQSICYAY